jgi:hypothetical protein
MALLLCTGTARADEFALARAFAVFEPEQLTHFVHAPPPDAISSYRYGRGQNVVHLALENRAHPWAVLLAFTMGADINHADARGRTPLFKAIDANLPAATFLLMELGADRIVPGTDGATVFDLCRVIQRETPDHETCHLMQQITRDDPVRHASKQ